jgi:long-chain fatty acid transport protein
VNRLRLYCRYDAPLQRAALIFAGILAWSPDALAGGFQISDVSARATSLGGAVVAVLDDPGAVTVNPAILTSLRGTNLTFGAMASVPTYRFSGPLPSTTTSNMVSQAVFAPNIALTFAPAGPVAFGITAAIPYMLKTEWDPSWAASRVVTKAEIRSIVVSPAIGYQAFDNLAIGFSVNIAASKVLMSNQVGFEPLTVPDGTATYEGNSPLEYGFQAGVVYRPLQTVTLAFAYRSRVRVQVDDGRATFLEVPSSLAAAYQNGPASTTLVTPENFHAGASVLLGGFITLHGEVQLVGWSTFDQLRITFADPTMNEIVIPEHWMNSYILRAGIEVMLAGATVRAGAFFDQSPIPDEYLRPSVPDADRTGISVGIGSTVGNNLHLDFALAYVSLSDRTITTSRVEYLPQQYLNGTYSGSGTIAGLNVSYRWN